MKRILLKGCWGGILLLWALPLFALQEHHVIFLMAQEKGQIAHTGETLLAHGFDNRNIVAVYVAMEKKALACAAQLMEMGLFTADKLHHQAAITRAFYDQVVREGPQGHIVLIAQNTEMAELIEDVTHMTVDRHHLSPYIVPIT